jgi:uncharacterized membrane protein
MIAPPEFLVTMFKPWNDFYGHSKVVETIVVFLHVAGLLLSGGFAIAADRGTLRAFHMDADARVQRLKELAAVHRWVITGLGIIVVSGLALLTSDIETFFPSWVFWVKMALVVMLLTNGLMMTRAEASLAKDAADTSPHWAALRRTAVTSLSLWFTITLLGVALTNVA